MIDRLVFFPTFNRLNDGATDELGFARKNWDGVAAAGLEEHDVPFDERPANDLVGCYDFVAGHRGKGASDDSRLLFRRDFVHDGLHGGHSALREIRPFFLEASLRIRMMRR